MISLDDSIVKLHGAYWHIVQATDLETAHSAIVSAAVSGSVGCTTETREPNGEVSHFAKVERVINLDYQVQGVYGSWVEPVKWSMSPYQGVPEPDHTILQGKLRAFLSDFDKVVHVELIERFETFADYRVTCVNEHRGSFKVLAHVIQNLYCECKVAR